MARRPQALAASSTSCRNAAPSSADDVGEDVQHARAGGQLLLRQAVARGGLLRVLLLRQRLREHDVPGCRARVVAVRGACRA